MQRIKKVLSLTLAASLLASCNIVTPKLEIPPAPGPDKFKEADQGNWQTASANAGQVDKGEWWLVFNEPTLNTLQTDARQNNPSLQAAAARVEQADAAIRQVRARLYPTLDLNVGFNRNYNSGAFPTFTNYFALGVVSWGVDLFGRVQQASTIARLEKQQVEQLYNQTMLLLHADVAQNYFALLALDSERDLLQQTIKLREDSQSLVDRRFKEGEANQQESLRAQAELASTRADLTALDQQRALVEHVLAILTGRAPSEFSQVQGKLPTQIPVVPAGLPSSVLERRPDIAAAQSRLAANNARVGLGRLAFFPSISLTAQGGFNSPELEDVPNWSSRSWSLGPLLSVPIFDGGRRRADLALANAVYQENVATYRQNVLAAFREVEDNLSTLRLQAARAEQLYQAADTAKKAENISQVRYREGETNFLEVLDTQRDTLAAQRLYTQVQGQRFITTVNLIRALGGGWTVSAAPVTKTPIQPEQEKPDVVQPAQQRSQSAASAALLAAPKQAKPMPLGASMLFD